MSGRDAASCNICYSKCAQLSLTLLKTDSSKTASILASQGLQLLLLLQTRELSADQKAQLKQQAQKYESQLASNSADVEALEGAGVSYAQLGDFKHAETLIAKLTSARPTDPEAWRLLVCFRPASQS